MITIRHSHAEGTVICGSRKGDGVWEIVKTFGFRYSHHVGIYLRGSRDKDAPTATIDAAAHTLRAAGFDVAVDIDDTWRPAAERERDRAERAQSRAERLDARSQAAQARGQAKHAAARRTLDAIPAGQPMLPDHHSYPADRRRRERAWSNMDNAAAEDRHARDLAARADASRTHEQHQDSSRVTLRRIERLQAELRRWQRAAASASTEQYRPQARRHIERLSEDIAHQQGKIAERAASGVFVPWAREHFAKGDLIGTRHGIWYEVTRVNVKSVSVACDGYPSTVPFHNIVGRRRDGSQLDTPNAQPWPQRLAIKVARWQHLAHLARLPDHNNAAQARTRHVQYTMRLVHRLDPDAAHAEVDAFWPADTEADAEQVRRDLSQRYLAAFDRLQAGATLAEVAASLPVCDRLPRWRLPDGDGTLMHPQDLQPGDLVKGIWDHGYSGRYVIRSFAGPVASVGPVQRRHEAGTFVTVTLTDGASSDLRTHDWLAVFPADDRSRS